MEKVDFYLKNQDLVQNFAAKYAASKVPATLLEALGIKYVYSLGARDWAYKTVSYQGIYPDAYLRGMLLMMHLYWDATQVSDL